MAIVRCTVCNVGLTVSATVPLGKQTDSLPLWKFCGVPSVLGCLLLLQSSRVRADWVFVTTTNMLCSFCNLVLILSSTEQVGKETTFCSLKLLCGLPIVIWGLLSVQNARRKQTNSWSLYHSAFYLLYSVAYC
jgi:hypothetical protein